MNNIGQLIVCVCVYTLYMSVIENVGTGITMSMLLMIHLNQYKHYNNVVVVVVVIVITHYLGTMAVHTY